MCSSKFSGKMLQGKKGEREKILLQTNTKSIADLKLKPHGCAVCIAYFKLPHLFYKFSLSDALNLKNPKREIR